MKIYFASLTGNVRNFMSKTGFAAEEITPLIKPTEPFILITYTIGIGEVPEPVATFLDAYGHLLKGVAVSGNRNWGANFGRAGDLISQRYKVPLLLRFELRGTENDVRLFKEKVGELIASY